MSQDESITPKDALDAAYSLLIGLGGPDHEQPDRREYEEVMEKVEAGIEQLESGEGNSENDILLPDVDPIEHEGDAVVMRLAVRKLGSSDDGKNVIVRAINQSESGMMFEAGIKNPMVPSLSIDDILRLRLKVEKK